MTNFRHIAVITQNHFFTSIAKWLLLTAIIGILVGSVSAFFLVSLNWVTNWRENHIWIITLLPVAGLFIGLMYHYLGSTVVKGNNLLIEEFYTPKKTIPFRMLPLVLLGTLATHFFGGSAGREGTAVQMGGAIADRFTHLFKLEATDRKIILIVGISAGFASVFGTPVAAAIFALEIMVLGNITPKALLPAFSAAFIAHYTCLFYNVVHTHYTIPFVPKITPVAIGWTISAGIIFGLAALLFSKSIHLFTRVFNATINYPPLRPFVGGLIIASAVGILGTTKYIGLGLPTITDAFSNPLPEYDFIIKLLLTAITLGAGFKGGEVTPLFFIGATLGNLLCLFIPLPLALLAGMGFVAVFSGATNTPLACIIMGIELFGMQSGVYIAVACITAYLFSGHTGIYTSQSKTGLKHILSGYIKDSRL